MALPPCPDLDYEGKKQFLKDLCQLVKGETWIRAMNYWNVDTCAKGYCYQISVFSKQLASFEPAFYYKEFVDCIMDEDLFVWSGKEGRLISDKQFMGVWGEEEEEKWAYKVMI